MSDADRSTSPPPRGVALERRRSVGDLLTQAVLPALALGLAGFAAWYVWSSRPVEHAAPPPVTPPRSPWRRTLACAGIVEAQSENISIGTPVAGVVTEVLVRVGDRVEPGAPLVRLDDRDLRGALAVRRAAIEEAKAELLRLDAAPRRETLPPLVAAVKESRAAYDAAADGLRRAEELFARKVITEQDVITKRDEAAYTGAAVEKTEAELALHEAGAWAYDRDVSRAALGRAEADLESIEIDIDRLTIRARVAAQVLQVNVRPGEFVGTPAGQGLVVIGDVDRLHVRVDIDEFEIGRFDRTAPAVATPRGAPADVHTLRFVRVEPFVVPKKSLTGDNSERVDTRVLQVIYECEPSPDGATGDVRRLFVGQQVDVSIEASPAPPAVSGDAPSPAAAGAAPGTGP